MREAAAPITLPASMMRNQVAAVACVLASCGHEVSPLVQPDGEDERLFREGFLDFEAERFAVAQDEFDEIVTDFPESRRHAEAWVLAGRCRFEQGAYEDALATLTAMRQAHPDSRFEVSAVYYLGRSHAELERWVEAEPEMRRVLELDPEGVFGDNAHYWLGRSLQEQARLPEAQLELERVMAIGPASDVFVDATYYLGRTRFDMAYYSGALIALRLARE